MMEGLLTPALFKEVLLQCGLAGLLILAACWGFRIIMNYLAAKDALHAKAWEIREDKFLKEMEVWRGSIAVALTNNTTAMNGLTDMIREADKEMLVRHHADDRKLDQILNYVQRGHHPRGT